MYITDKALYLNERHFGLCREKRPSQNRPALVPGMLACTMWTILGLALHTVLYLPSAWRVAYLGNVEFNPGTFCIRLDYRNLVPPRGTYSSYAAPLGTNRQAPTLLPRVTPMPLFLGGLPRSGPVEVGSSITIRVFRSPRGPLGGKQKYNCEP
jgi:hypothetical protein